MIQLSRMADYGIVILGALADKCPNTPCSATTLAEDTTLPQPTVSQILKSLNKANLITAQRGAHGGYVLSNEPQSITLCNIVEAIDGPIALTHCAKQEDECCSIAQICGLQPEMIQVNQDIRQALSKVSLAQLKKSRSNNGN